MCQYWPFIVADGPPDRLLMAGSGTHPLAGGAWRKLPRLRLRHGQVGGSALLQHGQDGIRGGDTGGGCPERPSPLCMSAWARFLTSSVRVPGALVSWRSFRLGFQVAVASPLPGLFPWEAGAEVGKWGWHQTIKETPRRRGTGGDTPGCWLASVSELFRPWGRRDGTLSFKLA